MRDGTVGGRESRGRTVTDGSGGYHGEYTHRGHRAWQPGESGNPSGRPKGPSLRVALRRYLRDRRLNDNDPNSPTLQDAFVRSCVARALDGDARFAKIVANIAAPPKQTRVVIRRNTIQMNLYLEQPPPVTVT
jgi:hypothetical protein